MKSYRVSIGKTNSPFVVGRSAVLTINKTSATLKTQQDKYLFSKSSFTVKAGLIAKLLDQKILVSSEDHQLLLFTRDGKFMALQMVPAVLAAITIVITRNLLFVIPILIISALTFGAFTYHKYFSIYYNLKELQDEPASS